jgi:outer membrane protein assembly factor BamB
VSSPVVVNPDGTGLVAYIGDNGLSGNDDGGHLWAINAVDPNPAEDCSPKWSFNAYGDPVGSHPEAGTWSPPAFGRDVTGRALIVFGGSSTDNSVYGADALTGDRLWRFQTEVFLPDNDVGAGATISAPGVNGFADGVAYIAGKNKIVYALNLRTGTRLWEFRIRDDAPTVGGATRSTAALLGDRLYIGYGAGVYALDARGGAKVWRSADVGPETAEVIPSPAISGPDGDRVIFAGDMAGEVFALSVASGQRLWSYPTDAFVYSSPVVAAGRMFVAGSDGFLYAFGFGGGVNPRPDTTLDSPVSGTILPNPAGTLALSGGASDEVTVTDVLVGVKDKVTNKWWDAESRTWKPVFVENRATLTAPGTPSTGWTFTFPVPDNGGNYFAQADALDASGQRDPTVASTEFSVASLGNPPETSIDYPQLSDVFYFPAGRASFPLTVGGTATDTGGANPGVADVRVVIKNIEHNEYYCGPAGCPVAGGGRVSWSGAFTSVPATLSNPAGTSTDWSYSFPTYDHPHKYRIVAWAVDADGEVDNTRAVVDRICVRDPGDSTCSYT